MTENPGLSECSTDPPWRDGESCHDLRSFGARQPRFLRAGLGPFSYAAPKVRPLGAEAPGPPLCPLLFPVAPSPVAAVRFCAAGRPGPSLPIPGSGRYRTRTDDLLVVSQLL